MLTRLGIEGFKRFNHHSFELRPLTILAGMNGTGKTSVVHSLLLAREAWRRGDGVIELNGPFGLELGEYGDVLNYEALSNFTISITSEGQDANEWTFSEGATALYAEVLGSEGQTVFSARPRTFQYLQAERLGPRITLGSAALPPAMLEVGDSGQYSAQVLDVLGRDIVEQGRLCDEGIPPLLKAQAEAWLSLITRPLQIDSENFPGTPVTALKFRTSEMWVKPTNMGFGVTYALPVILAGLTAASGGLVIIENPEAHLHPAGQSHMGLFLAKLAASGVQVMVETHSDHVLNGIRLAIGHHKVLSAKNAVVHYFDFDKAEPEALGFTEVGGISSWPKGFFDQYQLDVAALTRIRRPR